MFLLLELCIDLSSTFDQFGDNEFISKAHVRNLQCGCHTLYHQAMIPLELHNLFASLHFRMDGLLFRRWIQGSRGGNNIRSRNSRCFTTWLEFPLFSEIGEDIGFEQAAVWTRRMHRLKIHS